MRILFATAVATHNGLWVGFYHGALTGTTLGGFSYGLHTLKPTDCATPACDINLKCLLLL